MSVCLQKEMTRMSPSFSSLSVRNNNMTTQGMLYLKVDLREGNLISADACVKQIFPFANRYNPKRKYLSIILGTSDPYVVFWWTGNPNYKFKTRYIRRMVLYLWRSFKLSVLPFAFFPVWVVLSSLCFPPLFRFRSFFFVVVFSLF